MTPGNGGSGLVMIIDHDRKGNILVLCLLFCVFLVGIGKKIRALTQLLLLCFGCLEVFTDPDFQFNK